MNEHTRHRNRMNTQDREALYHALYPTAAPRSQRRVRASRVCPWSSA